MITTYQIRNVLRVYGNQLKKRSLSNENPTEKMAHYMDSVNISIEARRKEGLNKMSSQLITKVNPARGDVEK